MNRLLREKAREQYAEAIVSLDRALLLNAATLPRTDYVFVSGNRTATRHQGEAYLPANAPPAEYTAERPLQVIELVIENGEDLIEGLYATLWGGQLWPA
jgi:2-hydroxychromene-2-carboxylate isomerase